MLNAQEFAKKLGDPVFQTIEARLKKDYGIDIRSHMAMEGIKGTIDPSLGGQIKGLKNSLDVTLPPFLVVGGTVLQGITFQPADFKKLFSAIFEARRKDGKGEKGFHFNNDPDNLTMNILTLDLLSISYQQTTVGLSKERETKAMAGFREIADSHNMTIGQAEVSQDVLAGPGLADEMARNSLRFGLKPKSYQRRIDISSIHVALNPGACNIHIDDVGFVLRGPKGAVGLDPDFLQHLVNELLLKSKLREKFVAKYGEGSTAVWAVDHLSVVLPSSDNKYKPTVGASFDTNNVSLSAAVSFDCKCLNERVSMDERFGPKKNGISFGLGLEVRW